MHADSLKIPDGMKSLPVWFGTVNCHASDMLQLGTYDICNDGYRFMWITIIDGERHSKESRIEYDSFDIYNGDVAGWIASERQIAYEFFKGIEDSKKPKAITSDLPISVEWELVE